MKITQCEYILNITAMSILSAIKIFTGSEIFFSNKDPNQAWHNFLKTQQATMIIDKVKRHSAKTIEEKIIEQST